MSLSVREQSMLEGLAAGLWHDDPRLADLLSGVDVRRPDWSTPTGRRLRLMFLVAAVGVVLVVVGVAALLPPLTIAGLVVVSFAPVPLCRAVRVRRHRRQVG